MPPPVPAADAPPRTPLAGRLFEALAARPFLTLGAMLAAAALGGWAASGADVDFTPQSVLSGRDDLAAALEDAHETFGHEDAVLLVLLMDDRPEDRRADGGVLGAAALTWQRRAVRDLPALPGVSRVEGLPTIEVGRLSLSWQSFGTYETVPLVPDAPGRPVAEDEAAWVRRQLADGRAEGLASANGRTAAIAVVLEPDVLTAAGTRAVVADVQAYLAAHPPPAGLTTTIGGMPALRAAIVDGLAADTEFLFPLSGGLFLAALGLAFRRPIGVAVPLVAVGCGLAWAVGLLTAAGTTFGILANVLPVLLTVIGFAAAVHVLTRYGEEAEAGGVLGDGVLGDGVLGDGSAADRRHGAARRTFVAMAPAVGLTLGTTAVGFGSLATANSDAVRAFAGQAAMGLGCLYLSTLAAFAALGPRFRPPRRPGGGAWGLACDPAVPLARLAVRFPKLVLAGGVAAVAAAGLAAAGSANVGLPARLWEGVRVNSRMLETHDESHPAARAVRRVERDLGGVIAVEAILSADRPGALLEPEAYARTMSAAAAARELAGVVSVRTYTDLYQRALAGVRRDPDALAEPPAGPDAAGRIRQAGSFLQKTAPGATDPFLTADGRRGRISVRVRDLGTADTLALLDRLDALLARRFPPGSSSVRYAITGDGAVNARGMDRFVRDFLWGLLGAVAVIFAAVGLAFRSLRAGLIAAVPNLAPLALTAGYLWLRGYDLNAGNAIVFAVGLGIAVDDTVHVLARFREEMSGGEANPAAAAVRTAAATGRAVVLTTGLILCGLSALLWSEFVPTRRFAELTCATLAAALLADLLLLPAALTLFWRGSPAG